MNIRNYIINLTYSVGEKVYTIDRNNDFFTFHEYGEKNHLKIKVITNKEVNILKAELIYNRKFNDEEFFFSNGYQSWTTSKEYKNKDRQYGLLTPTKIIPIAKKYAETSGDYSFANYRKKLFHSHTYTYFRKEYKLEFIGSLNERTGYTIFYMDTKNDSFTISKDVEGLKINGEYELFNIIYFEGLYDEVFDSYFEFYVDKSKKNFERLVGYTSWYNYYSNINENILIRDLNGLHSKINFEANTFQIDDGYQNKIGDWLSVNKSKFPNGMKYIAHKIHEKGYKAGIWLSPFSVQYKSALALKHPEWLLKNKKGKNIIGGLAWGGFYVLDIDNPKAREYIRNVFDVMLNNWNFDIVKLDFLYCIAIEPRNGKTRGQLMHEAIDFLRDCCGDKTILGCGVPLSPTWGKLDCCRIGCDVGLSFKDSYYTSTINQETGSTRLSINNSIFRRHLNERVFSNDTDVFFLRNDGEKLVKFNIEQKKLLSLINNIFGNVLFISDNVQNYDENSLEILKKSYKKFDGKILSAEYTNKKNILINYMEHGIKKELKFNVISGKHKIEIIK